MFCVAFVRLFSSNATVRSPIYLQTFFSYSALADIPSEDILRWSKVAAIVGSRSEDECQDFYSAMLDSRPGSQKLNADKKLDNVAKKSKGLFSISLHTHLYLQEMRHNFDVILVKYNCTRLVNI